MTDQKQTRVCDDDLEFDEHGRAKHDGKLFTGIAWESPSGGMYMSEVQYQEGLEHGPSVDWYEAGKMAARQVNCYGTKHGLEEEWFWDGSPRLLAFWENGLRVRLQRWDESGTVIENWELPPDDPQRRLASNLEAAVQAIGSQVSSEGKNEIQGPKALTNDLNPGPDRG